MAKPARSSLAPLSMTSGRAESRYDAYGESALGHGHGLLRREAGQVRPRLDAGLGARQFGTHDVTDARASGERAVEELHRADGRAGKEAKSGQVRGR
jgi:hypothetical protein